jgi:hypothetical protein
MLAALHPEGIVNAGRGGVARQFDIKPSNVSEKSGPCVKSRSPGATARFGAVGHRFGDRKADQRPENVYKALKSAEDRNGHGST